MHKKTYYYVTGNTAEGFVNFLPSNIKQIDQIIMLDHPSNPLKTTLLKKIITYFEPQYDLEIINSTFGNDFLDGVIIRDKSLAIITDTLKTDEIEAEVINLEQFVPLISDESTVSVKKKINAYMDSAYKNFAAGLKIHDRLEAIFISEMDFKKADKIAETFIENLLKDVKRQDKNSSTVRRLFGTNTPEGAVNVVPEILADLSYCYFLKGRAGTGKSTFMRKVIKACEEYGLDLEVYHCSFDPNSIDMVLARGLDFCIFDSTDPHEFFPERKGDFVIDLYEKTVTPGTDEKYETDIKKVTKDYKSFMKKGMDDLRKARMYQHEWEEKYRFNGENVDYILKTIIGRF